MVKSIIKTDNQVINTSIMEGRIMVVNRFSSFDNTTWFINELCQLTFLAS